MPAYIISSVEVLDLEAYKPVPAGVGASFAPYGGRYLARRARCEVLEGEWQLRQHMAIVEFPSYDDAKQWYESEDYRPLRDVRWRTAKSDVLLVEGIEQEAGGDA